MLATALLSAIPAAVGRAFVVGPPEWTAWAHKALGRTALAGSPLAIEVAADLSSIAGELEQLDPKRVCLVLFAEPPEDQVARRQVALGTFIAGLRSCISDSVLAIDLSRKLTTLVVDCSLRRLVSSPGAHFTHDNGSEVEVDQCPEAPRSDSLADDQLRTITLSLRPLCDALLLGAPLRGFSWPLDVFLAGDEPDSALPARIELAGGARILSYGPYFLIPTGQWQVVLTLAFSGNPTKVSFLVEIVVAHEVIYRGYFDAAGDGLFELPFRFDIDRHIPVELRILTLEAVLDGQMFLIDASFSRPQGTEITG
jgi:hypothetical protein